MEKTLIAIATIIGLVFIAGCVFVTVKYGLPKPLVLKEGLLY